MIRSLLSTLAGLPFLMAGLLPMLFTAFYTWPSGFCIGCYEGGLRVSRFHHMTADDILHATGLNWGSNFGLTLLPAFGDNNYQSYNIVPSWPLIPLGLWLSVRGLRAAARHSSRGNADCPTCGYNISGGSASAPCPECGTPTSANRAPDAISPTGNHSLGVPHQR